MSQVTQILLVPVRAATRTAQLVVGPLGEADGL